MRASRGEVVSGLGTCRGGRSRPQSHPAQRISPECQGLSFCRSRGEFGEGAAWSRPLPSSSSLAFSLRAHAQGQ